MDGQREPVHGDDHDLVSRRELVRGARLPELTGNAHLCLRRDDRFSADERLGARYRATAARPAQEERALADVEKTAGDDRDDPPRPRNDKDREQDSCKEKQLAAVRASRRIEVHQLEVHHLRGVSVPRAQLHDPRVAARPLGEPGCDLGEQLMDDILGAKLGDRLAPRRQVAALAERDHLLGERLDRLRLRFRRLDPTVLDQRAREVRVERLAVRRVAAELLACAVVPHV